MRRFSFKIIVLLACIKSIANCSAFTDNVFPLVYGNYYSYVDETTQTADYKYCRVDNVTIIDMNMYPNGDILSAFYLSIINNPNDFGLQVNISAIVKIDHGFGKTLWAKKMYYYVDSIDFKIVRIFLMSETAWIFLSGFQDNIYYQGIVVKVDGDGNIIEAFYILNNYLSAQFNYFLSIQDFYLLSDFSIIAGARCTYNPGEFGVSSNSQYDFCFFKIENNRNFKWSTSIDYLNGVEERFSMYEFNDSVYLSITTSKYYYCILNLDKVFGSVVKSKCAYVKKNPNNTDYRRLEIFLITDKYIYADGSIFLSKSINSEGVFLFNLNTFDLNKVYYNDYCLKVFGFSNQPLMRDEVHCFSDKYLFVSYIYAYTSESNNSIITEDNSYSSIIDLSGTGYPFSIKKSFDGMYIIAIQQKPLVYQINTNRAETLLFKYDSDFNTRSCFKLDKFIGIKILSEIEISSNPNSQFQIYTDDSVTPNIFTTYSSSLYNRSADIFSYDFGDITECIWPKFISNSSDCVAQLPVSLLNGSYNLMIGSNINNMYTYQAFTQIQNSRFVIEAVDDKDQPYPNWLSIDQINQNITINSTAVNSIGSTLLLFSARLITYNANSNDTSSYTTDNTLVNFTFTNKNCVFINSNSSYYILINELYTFVFEFLDEEDDKAIIMIKQSDINTYVQQDSTSRSKVKLLLQSDNYTEDPLSIICYYTDSYHQNIQYYQTMNISLSIFKVDPPYFVTVPPIFNADRCSNYLYELPKVIDPNNLAYNITFESPLPDWISAISNNSLSLNTKSTNYSIPETTILNIKLINENKSWRKYNLTIVTEHYDSPSFDIIDDIFIPMNSIKEIKIKTQGASIINVVDCNGVDLILWITVIKSNTVMRINSANIFRHSQCVMLSSVDSCGNNVYSNKFNITFSLKNSKPPSVCNSFGPLKVITDEKALFLIPTDLFISEDNFDLNYSVSMLSCSVNSSLTAAISRSDFDKKNYLLIFSNQAKTCYLSLKAEDSNTQSAEIIVEVIIVNCASKDCVKCTSEYQSSCTQCKYNYILSIDGTCLINSSYFPNSEINFYRVCGIIVLICLVIQTLLFFILGLKALYPLEFSQTFIIIIYSVSQVNQDMDSFISWIQFFKFDFGFLDIIHIKEIFHCSSDIDRMKNIKFYCSSLMLNYAYLIIIAILIIIIIVISKILSTKSKMMNKVYNFFNYNFNRVNIAWVAIHL